MVGQEDEGLREVLRPATFPKARLAYLLRSFLSKWNAVAVGLAFHLPIDIDSFTCT